jgi:hypothetical protein
VRLAGEIAFARRYTNGDLRLAVVKGTNAVAAVGAWELRSAGPVAMEVKGMAVEGESSGDAHDAIVALPAAYGVAMTTVDGKPVACKQEGNRMTIALPAGAHAFTIQGK